MHRAEAEAMPYCSPLPGQLPLRSATAILAALAIGLSLVASQEAISAESGQTPNIVLIVADDLGFRELGCYGQQWIKTPHIDRIAREGIRFTQHYSGNAVCAPSRCNLLTGKHPGHAHVRNNGDPKDLQHLKEKYGWEFPGQNPIPDAEVTLAELLKQQGYATGAMGKWGLGHFGTSGDPNRQGFDLFYGFNCQRHAHNHYPRFLWRNDQKEMLPGNDRTLSGATYSQDRFIEVASEFIRANREQPFFLYLPFAIPHLSIQVPEESLAQYKGVIPEQDYTHKGYLRHPHPRAGYAAMVSHMDRGVGRIMSLLEELDLDEQTLILFTSDNGPTYDRLGGSDSEFFQSAGDLRGFKGSLYEGGIRAPLVARWPGKIPPGQTSTLVSASWDLLPTCTEAVGVAAPQGIDGISLLPAMLGENERQQQHDYLYWEFPAYGGQQAMRRGDWKAVRQNMLRRNNPDPLRIELYNLADDPGEQHDLAAEHPQRVAQFASQMKVARIPSAVFPFPVLDR